MHLIQAIKFWLRSGKAASPAEAVAKGATARSLASIITNYEARHAQDVAQAVEDSRRLSDRYGSFNTFLYQPHFDLFLRKEVLPFQQPSKLHLGFLDMNNWRERHPFNFPGPFYVGESDTCGTGVCEAPINVGNDAHCCEYVFRQPSTYEELAYVLNAAVVEAFDSYSSNGNEYWTYEACKAWWRNREIIVRDLLDPRVARMNNGQNLLYLKYLQGEAEMDLRRYCFFLEHGVYPSQAGVALPEL
ncbi:hypothetical protein [Hymenobacter sp. CRA2]|uniref:hypothetical protein n=1 Tax=Hymenobacter sp. CRA2 TaxID=1955620 RepID=UPI00098F16A4|nr:hypothetical protein [Hymenobacter sp. CRA2]OON69460.1 hypothetical protein B0919_09300 [Hymenobacter sp. CRA2]